MSKRGQGTAEAVIPLSSAPKLNSRAEVVDRAAQTILGTINRAATNLQASYRQGLEINGKLAAQVRAAEQRISELEVAARYHEDCADRAEKWLYKISVELEHFVGRDEDSSQPPPVASKSQRR
jgi:DNA repair ATPase RecN